jgi:hypothetical protein
MHGKEHQLDTRQYQIGRRFFLHAGDVHRPRGKIVQSIIHELLLSVWEYMILGEDREYA